MDLLVPSQILFTEKVCSFPAAFPDTPQIEVCPQRAGAEDALSGFGHDLENTFISRYADHHVWPFNSRCEIEGVLQPPGTDGVGVKMMRRFTFKGSDPLRSGLTGANDPPIVPFWGEDVTQTISEERSVQICVS